LRLFSFGGYGLALAALALVVFGAYDSYPFITIGEKTESLQLGLHELNDPSWNFEERHGRRTHRGESRAAKAERRTAKAERSNKCAC